MTSHLRSLLIAQIAYILIFGGTAHASDVTEPEASTITIVNISGKRAKAAAPGAKAIRIHKEETPIEWAIEPTDPNGVEVKAWWTAKPRELCVIFVRYGGVLKIGGKKNIRCLGN